MRARHRSSNRGAQSSIRVRDGDPASATVITVSITVAVIIVVVSAVLSLGVGASMLRDRAKHRARVQALRTPAKGAKAEVHHIERARDDVVGRESTRGNAQGEGDRARDDW